MEAYDMYVESTELLKGNSGRSVSIRLKQLGMKQSVKQLDMISIVLRSLLPPDAKKSI